jgi:hypothetical protein
MRELQRARERSDAWPEWHLLWELHPLSEWLCDRLVAHMSRHAAPIVRVNHGIAAGTRDLPGPDGDRQSAAVSPDPSAAGSASSSPSMPRR